MEAIHEQNEPIKYIARIQYFNNREEFKIGFDIILLFYKDVLNYKLGKILTVFNDYENDIIEISQKNELKALLNKINIISTLKEKIKFNANATLLLDKLIIELEGCE